MKGNHPRKLYIFNIATLIPHIKGVNPVH